MLRAGGIPRWAPTPRRSASALQGRMLLPPARLSSAAAEASNSEIKTGSERRSISAAGSSGQKRALDGGEEFVGISGPLLDDRWQHLLLPSTLVSLYLKYQSNSTKQ